MPCHDDYLNASTLGAQKTRQSIWKATAVNNPVTLLSSNSIYYEIYGCTQVYAILIPPPLCWSSVHIYGLTANVNSMFFRTVCTSSSDYITIGAWSTPRYFSVFFHRCRLSEDVSY